MTHDELLKELEELRRRNTLLEESEAHLRAVFDYGIQGFILLDRDYRIKLINPVMKEIAWQLFAIEPQQGESLLSVFPEHYRERFAGRFSRALSGEKVYVEDSVQARDGALFWFEFFYAPVISQTDTVSDVFFSAFDITARKHHEDQIEASLNEKEVLLKEIHHRVKNNMQIISSLLNLQARYISDPNASKLFLESQNRVRSMALIHEKLYHSKNLSSVNFSEYLRSLVSFLCHACGRGSIFCSIKAEKLMMGVDIAIPCGLIVNELVSNALMHAFPDEHQGTVRIELKPSKEGEELFVLSISDNGIGFQGEKKFEESQTLGLQLVRDLVEQIDGKLELKQEKGTTFTITVPTHYSL